MHRTYFVPRLLGCWSLVIALMLLSGQVVTAQAPVQAARFDQGPPEIKQEVPVVTLTVGTTQIYQAKANLKRVENNNSKVLNVSAVPKEFDKVRLEGLATGRARVSLTDQKDQIELIDVVIISDRVKELREAIARAVPTGSVSVNSTDSGNTIVVSGTVLSTDDARVIQQLGASVGGNVISNVRLGGVQQVQLEVVIAVVNRSEARNMSFSWLTSNRNWFVASVTGGPGSVASGLVIPPTAVSLSSTGANIPFGVLNGSGGTIGFLNALRTEGLSKILAEPRLTTLSGRPARVVSGGHVDIISSGVSSAQISADFGTIVNFLPIVLGNGKIHMEVASEVSTPTTSIPIPGAGSAGTVSFSVLKRSANVAVQMEDGQTLVIAGLIQNNVDATIDRVPVLGDLPYLGVLFSKKSYIQSEEELVIIVTPRLVDPIDCTKIPRYLPGRETRSPDDFELFLEGIMEAPRGPRNVALHPHAYQAAYKSSPNIGLYPCGDNGRGGPGCAQGSCAPNQLGGLGLPTNSTRIDFARPMPMPTPSFPEVPAIPTSNPSSSAKVELLPATPRDSISPLGPVTPTVPTPTTQREAQPRPVLPPVNSLPPR